ncbi:MAG: phosphoribosylaminoimidazolesuccinocarboxamide synthase [candidate division WOR-3 bacterium]
MYGRTSTVTNTDLPALRLVARGKVRDIYELGDNLLIVSTDRLSTFDVVLADGIPDKGRVLNLLSFFWFRRFGRLVPNHMIGIELKGLPQELQNYRQMLEGRSMIVRRAKPLPVECVVRGYLAGSAWAEYQRDGRIAGLQLPSGLEQAARLPEPVFTPATKATTGHDENISFEHMVGLVGEDVAHKIRRISLDLYTNAAAYALERGIIIADTKFEFGMIDNKLVLIDEVLTPDSSRFWSAAEYRPGMSPPSFDKQFVRDWLVSQRWNKQPPVPRLPAEVIAGTAARYREAYRMLTGNELP